MIEDDNQGEDDNPAEGEEDIFARMFRDSVDSSDKQKEGGEWPPKSEDDWNDFFLTWKKRYYHDLRAKLDYGCSTRDAVRTYAGIAVSLARKIFDQTRKHNPTRDEIETRLLNITALVANLYEGLHPFEANNPPIRTKSIFWQHITEKKFTGLGYTMAPADSLPVDYISDLATTYLSCEWMEDPYLDWVFADAMIFGELQCAYEAAMDARFGLGFAFFGVGVKAFAFKFVFGLTNFGFGWILPAYIAWWTYPNHQTSTLISVALYYFASLAWLFVGFVQTVSYRLKTRKSPKWEIMERLFAVEAVYLELREEAIHTPSFREAIEKSRKAGVFWKPQLLSIVDNVSARSPITWIRRQPETMLHFNENGRPIWI